ncbi:hypothetical protein D9Q98_006130 [Chlorella vulgaris]|uniref:Damage-control phosphatase ARMT1-like metal-binding domain-containing protein n=1 Tax=Chlorella vulgaris TaxID=3077 RepID=A0A9D4TXH5_CHLVU|nr:hypothetical protein D9Q98_006130 [Chlorella vulgaris]
MTVAETHELLASQSCTSLVPLPQLLHVQSYNPNALLDTYVPRSVLEKSGKPTNPALEDWIEIFRHSIGSFKQTAEADASRPQAERQRGADQFASTFLSMVNEIERQALERADSNGSIGCLELCRMREDALRAAGFSDIFLAIKQQENATALALLPDVCADLDQHTEQRMRWEAVLRGVFAGNIFDLGCAATTAAYHEGGIEFHATRDKLVERPWVIDDLDALLDRLCR